MRIPTTILCQSGKGYDPMEVFFWLGLIVLASILLAVIALWLRKALTGDVEPGQSLGFSLSDLREMHAQGHLSDEEFESAKAKMLARSRRDMDEAAEKASGQDNLRSSADSDLKLAPDDLDELIPSDEPTPEPGNAVDNDEISEFEDEPHADKNDDRPA